MSGLAAQTDPYPYSELVLDLVGSKWVIRILHRLLDGPKRYKELFKLTPGISHKMLASTLHMMEADEIVEHVFEPPQSGTYALTPFGVSLAEQIRDLCEWAKGHEAQLVALSERRRLRSLSP